ncbi:hypothetical protein [Promicromonospora iranensis]|uniref:Uncharacterized protein n=1 Tax=Promicromonospora iranensis TaxID=1105144 RepID=A0ABU2CIX0_9MICO|nr:hypothetical protein [Promicromonospora iranensis]MDR7381258.1 hypothetical protein [Promicromonospora iranensis]
MPVTLPRARFDVDPDGHLAVFVDGQPWQPPTDERAAGAGGGMVRLGRSDVLWARQQIANELGTPVLVEVVDTGQPYSDVIDPDGYQATEPPRRGAPPEPERGRYAPGEPVAISVVVARTHADEHGHVRYRLPAALGNKTVLVHGETSGTTLPLDPTPLPARATNTSETRSRPSLTGHSVDARRRQPSAGHAPQPARPTPRETPDAGMGAL